MATTAAEEGACIKACLKVMVKCSEQGLRTHGLSEHQLTQCMEEIFSGSATPAQVACFLTTLHLLGEDTVAILAASNVMRKHAVPYDLATPNPTRANIKIGEYRGEIIDIVGTGGDGIDTFNVSTAAAFVVVGAGGFVAKCGNRAASSKCGSADLLEAVGARLELTPSQQQHVFSACRFCFFFAQSYNPAMKSIGPIRKQMGIRTIFNYLGPLTNPASPQVLCAGVSSVKLGQIYADTFLAKGVQNGIVVHAENGMDEISPAGRTHLWLVRGATITKSMVAPGDFGLSEHSLDQVAGSTPAENAKVLKALLEGRMAAQPVEDFVVMNAAAAIVAARMCETFQQGVAAARAAIRSGKALKVLDDYVALTNANI